MESKIIVKVRGNKKTNQKYVTVPSSSDIEINDYVIIKKLEV